MATQAYVLTILLLSGSLVFSAAALCQNEGDDVLDTNGNQVRLGPNYQIEYTGSDGRKGVIGLLRNDQSQCEKYIGQTSHHEGRLVSFAPGNGLSQDNIMKEGDRYVFSSIATWNHPCKSPGEWTTGESPNGVHFKPIIAARDPDSNDIRPRLIQVTRAEEQEGAYKLWLCSCKQPKEQCSCSQVGTHDLNGQVVLGKNGQPITVRFVSQENLAM